MSGIIVSTMISVSIFGAWQFCLKHKVPKPTMYQFHVTSDEHENEGNEGNSSLTDQQMTIPHDSVIISITKGKCF